MKWWRKKIFDPEIAPDEIFLDSINPGAFDRARFEGRLEKPLHGNSFLLLGGVLTLVCLALVAQAWNLQGLQGTALAAQSERNSLARETLFATRGLITDTNGEYLAENVVGEDGATYRRYRTPGFGHLLGYVAYPKKDARGNYYDTTQTGLAGLEASFDGRLGGVNGTLLVERDAVGKVMSQGTVIPPTDGANLTLTIDVRAQDAFYKAISSLADKVPFAGGAAVMMDIETGEVIALVSYPEYDPNVLAAGAPAETISRYNTDNRKYYLDRAVAGLYAPGSIVKPLEAVGALTDGIITPDLTITSTGSLSVPNPYDPSKPTKFPDWKALGVLDLRRAIAFSSDVYFYVVGGGYGNQKGLGIERLAYWYRTFGLESVTGIEVPGEESGFIPTPAWKEETYDEIWRIGDTYHTAIGQYAMLTTPIEMVRAVAAIANGGKLLTPTLIEGARREVVELPVAPSALKVAREGMRQAVTEGTAIGLSSLDSKVRLGAKTGTAQTGVRNEFYNSWTIGFFPYEHPKYAFVVMMDKGPAGNSTGAVYVSLQALTALGEAAPEYFK